MYIYVYISRFSIEKEEDDGPFVTLCEALVGEKSNRERIYFA